MRAAISQISHVNMKSHRHSFPPEHDGSDRKGDISQAKLRLVCTRTRDTSPQKMNSCANCFLPSPFPSKLTTFGRPLGRRTERGTAMATAATRERNKGLLRYRRPRKQGRSEWTLSSVLHWAEITTPDLTPNWIKNSPGLQDCEKAFSVWQNANHGVQLPR